MMDKRKQNHIGEFKIYTVPHPSQAHGTEGQILRSPDKERGNPVIPLEEKGKNEKMNLHHIQLARETAPIKVDRREPLNGDSRYLGAQSYQMISVALQPKSTNRVTLKHEKTSVHRKGCSEQKDHREELMSGEKDLNKMADDFIARVNKQRRLEAELYKY
nr:PREDICTED: uncharacterized protein LOC108225301 [Daucus carota subsp. sativus]